MLKRSVYFLFLLTCSQIVKGQDTLPKVSVILLGHKALVSWVNPFETVTSINIQRSGDSVRNFKSIGTVLNVHAKSNGFVDSKEFLPNEQYYRLFISFEGGSYIFTEARQPVPDTSIAIPIPEEITETKEPKTVVQTWFVPSKHVYTGKDQNVIIALKDADHKKYSIKFFEDDGTFLFELKKVPESYLIVDKANFIHSGLFRFELFENNVLREMHKLYIPKAGKAMPSLDVNGYEIKR